nr:hypothetical protein [Tanacetum cinerariifolium]
DERRAISGHMLGASGVQIPKNNLDNLRSIVEEGTLEIMDPQELLGSFLLATNDLLILDLLIGTVFLASLDFCEFTNVTTGLDELLSIGIGFLRGTIAVVVILVKGNTFPTNVKFRLVGCDLLALVSKFTPVEESIALLETTFVENVVLMGVFPDEGICSINLIFLLFFTRVTTISLVPNSLMQGQVCLRMISNS